MGKKIVSSPQRQEVGSDVGFIAEKKRLTAGVLKNTFSPNALAFDLVIRLPARIWSKVDFPEKIDRRSVNEGT